MTGRQGWCRLDSFALRHGLLLALALLPVGLTAMVQSVRLGTQSQALSEVALTVETLRAVAPYLALTNQARGAVGVLAALDPATCGAVLPSVVSLVGGTVFAGIYDGNGRRLCGAGASPDQLATPTKGATTVGLALMDPHGRVLLALAPMRGGGFAAFAARPPSFLVDSARGDDLLLTDGAGEGKTALPTGRFDVPLLPAAPPTSSGEEHAFSIVELIDRQFYALGSHPVAAGARGGISDVLLSGLMWAISLIAAWLATETVLTLPIRRLRAALSAYAAGRAGPPDREPHLDLRLAPPELRETADAFQRMTQTMLQDKARLEETLAQNDALLREVHHRVKNNLQLIASIVNIQLRRTRSDEARRTLISLQDRMHGLATIHDRIYQTTDLTDVAVHRLFPGIVDQILLRAGARDQGLRVETRFDAQDLPLDKVVPLALLLTEAVTNAVRYVTGGDDADPVLSVSFQRGSGDAVVLEICNTARNPSAAAITGDHGHGIGTQLLRGFVAQLGGTFDRSCADGLYRVTIRLTLTRQSPSD